MILDLTKTQSDELYNKLILEPDNKTLSEIRRMIYIKRQEPSNNILEII